MAQRIRVIAALAFAVFCARPAVSHHHKEGSADAAIATPGNIADFRPGAMSIDRIRAVGTIPNLNQGIEIDIHNVSTRLIAWPGQGMVEGAIHLLTLEPGDKTGTYTYQVSEESLECIQGKGEVFLHGEWVTIEPGDVAYFPENVPHAIRNRGKSGDFVLIASITPPQLDLYEPSGLFDDASGTFSEAKIDQLEASSKPGNLTALTDLKYRNTHPKMRAWNLDNATIRKKGALFNIFYGARFEGIGVPMVIVLFPGFGTRNAGLHTGILPKGKGADAHTHPMSDDCIIYLQGKGNATIDGKSVDLSAFDAVAAPVLVPHGAGGPPPERSVMSGYGAPPQQELYERQGYVKDGKFIRPKFERLEDIEKSTSSDD
jgi:quercetin dioxygenase-like cupin family protein